MDTLKQHLQPVFLRWILIISLIGVGTVFLFTTGLVSQINDVDFTKISFLIFAVFVIYSFKTGRLTYKVTGLSRARDTLTLISLRKIAKETDSGWFWADAFTAAGMIGTVIGFIVMMSGTFDSVSSANIQAVITTALSKMGLALYTTASGMICSLLLKIQLFNLVRHVEKSQQ